MTQAEIIIDTLDRMTNPNGTWRSRDAAIAFISESLAARERAVWEEAAKHITDAQIDDPNSFTTMAFNDACKDIADWCRQQAEVVKP